MAYWTETFAGHGACIADVRRFTVVSLGDVPGVDDVRLVASELATNAIKHSDSGRLGGQFTVHLAAFVDHWHIRVDDAGGFDEPRLPSVTTNWDEAGRGLALVAAFSKDWGVIGDQYARAVWAEILMPEAVRDAI